MPSSLSTLLETLMTTATSLFGEVSSVLHGQQSSSSSDFEISTLDYPKDPQVDIVFVHGLGSDSSNAWSCIDESTGRQVSWPVTELPQRLHHKARILAYDYETDVGTAEYLVSRTLLHQTKRLIEALARRREGSRQRPIIFVCHSLGGIVVKNALVHASSRQTKEFRDVFDAVYGIVFLGTPHTTSPKALAESLIGILGPDAGDSLRRELRSRSTTLACSLERFKPLATNLSIFAISDSSSISRQDSGLDKERKNSRHTYLRLERNHAELAKFSSQTDQDLSLVIDCINTLCVEAVNNTANDVVQEEEVSAQPPVAVEHEVHDLGIGKALEKHLENTILRDTDRKKLQSLEDCFSRWFEASSSTADPDAWPIAILKGPPGSGKTQTALRYVSRHRAEYSSVLWVNATNQSSLEFSYRDIATQIVSKYPGSTPSAHLLGLDGIDFNHGQGHSQELDGEKLRIVERAVMEWLARPHEKKWLLVLDGPSPDSDYPLSPAWTGWLDQRTPVEDWWREFLGNLPATTGNRGHIVISTRSDVEGLGPQIIPFAPPRDEGWGTSAPNHPNTRLRFREWWQTAQIWEKRILGVTLFLSDAKCPRTPTFLFKPGLVEGLIEDENTWTSTPRVLESDGSCLRLSNEFLADGPLLLYHTGKTDVEDLDLDNEALKAAAQVNKVIVSVLSQAWEALSTGLQAIRNRRDLVIAWDDEKQVVHNISTLLRRCNSLTDQNALTLSLSQGNGHLVELAAVCASHAEYETARKLYDLQMERQHLSGEADLALKLDCARVYQQSGQYLDAEDQYKKIFVMYSEAFETPGIKPVDDRVTAYRQFASMRASQGKFDEAVKQVSQVLALEDPFGDDADQAQVTESIHELALYLFKSGNEQAASASLQRVLTSLEKTRGRMHPVTLSTMEILSTIKVKTGQIDEAQRLLNAVYDCQLERLGERHPKTVICMSRIAAAMDLGGNAEKAEGIFIKCLETAKDCLGARHPALFGIRDDFVRCLVGLGKQDEARKELETLKGEFKSSPGLYPSAVVLRIKGLLACKGDIDYMEVDSDLATRSTLGVGGFYLGEGDFNRRGSDYGSD
ncbi:hypothetical protein CEP51_000247 [Fusarium floridanum]|uniref:GPI inositol-deacylase n=1 Tax=Fusarium floridanum TaxID=1325733 RepID=A0A428SPB0_9HYPO|nr:hypothetical protein CEP51_000247 [Fusarium floridanum]